MARKKLKKGSAAAKAYMAKLRAMQGKKRKPAKKRKARRASKVITKANPAKRRSKRRRSLAGTRRAVRSNPRRRRRINRNAHLPAGIFRLMVKVRGRRLYWIGGRKFSRSTKGARTFASHSAATATGVALGRALRRPVYLVGAP